MLEAWSWSRSLKTNARSQEGRLSSKAEREPPHPLLKMAQFLFAKSQPHSQLLGASKRPKYQKQRAKKVTSDSPGLVDFAIGQVNSVFNLPDGQVMFFEEFE